MRQAPRVVLVASLVVAAIAAVVLAARFQLLFPRSDVRVDPPDVRAYRVDADRTLLVWPRGTEPGVMLVNRREAFVGTPSWYGTWVFGSLLWHRDAFASVWLRDGAKHERPHEYRFTATTLQIEWVTTSGTRQRTTVEFTH